MEKIKLLFITALLVLTVTAITAKNTWDKMAKEIDRRESFQALPYNDPGDGKLVVGYGSKISNQEAEKIKAKGGISKQEALNKTKAHFNILIMLLDKDVPALNYNQKLAVADLAYGMGYGALQKSKLWKLILTGEISETVHQCWLNTAVRWENNAKSRPVEWEIYCTPMLPTDTALTRLPLLYPNEYPPTPIKYSIEPNTTLCRDTFTPDSLSIPDLIPIPEPVAQESLYLATNVFRIDDGYQIVEGMYTYYVLPDLPVPLLKRCTYLNGKITVTNYRVQFNEIKIGVIEAGDFIIDLVKGGVYSKREYEIFCNCKL